MYQQMSNTTDDLLALVKRQQETIERQSKQIDSLLEKNGKLVLHWENGRNKQSKMIADKDLQAVNRR